MEDIVVLIFVVFDVFLVMPFLSLTSLVLWVRRENKKSGHDNQGRRQKWE